MSEQNVKSKNPLIIMGIVLAVVILLVIWIVSSYNSLVTEKEKVSTSIGNVQTQLQRRADLIPNFVNTVKGYTDYEQSTYTAVTQARAAVQGAATKGAAEIGEADAQLDKAIDVWVNAITEAYPELKANEQFTALTDELSGTENRIAKARLDYNEAVQAFNTTIRKFPKNIVAGLFGFDSAEYFSASSGAENVPDVQF